MQLQIYKDEHLKWRNEIVGIKIVLVGDGERHHKEPPWYDDVDQVPI